MAAHREPIEITPETTIREVIDRIAGSSGEAELRLGADRLHVVYRREVESPENTPAENGNLDQLLKVAREGKGSIDADAMIAFIYEMRDWEAENPRTLPPIE